jgi:ketosteroid isomerase-like protein
MRPREPHPEEEAYYTSGGDIFVRAPVYDVLYLWPFSGGGRAMGGRLGLLVVVSCLAVACGSAGNVDSERQKLIALDREWSQQVKDMEKFLGKYAPEGSLSLPGMPIATGHGAIRNAANVFAAAPNFSIRWSPLKADVGASGDLGYTAGTYRITRADPAGKPVTEIGKYVEVWKKDPGGNWKVDEFIFNPDAAPR